MFLPWRWAGWQSNGIALSSQIASITQHSASLLINFDPATSQKSRPEFTTNEPVAGDKL